MHTMTIGRLAKQAGVGIDTVRFYERAGLLPRPQRTASGYRKFSESDVRRLRFIRRSKDLGFTLEEIGELLALSGRGSKMGDVKRAAQARLAQVEQKIAELQRVRRGLRTLIEACPGHGELKDCPILAALGSGDSLESLSPQATRTSRRAGR
jgi:MerR family copper efflux transcriptional regulator